MAQTHFFELEPPGRFAGTGAAIRRPREITYFSYDEDHKFRLDDSSLRYYYPPSLPADLNRGFDGFKQLDDSKDEHLNGLLDAIAAYEREKISKLETDIITWRGMMTKIMVAPFSKLNTWEMNATLFQGTIFIEENHSFKLESRSMERSYTNNPRMKPQELMSFWGYKFESLSLLPQSWQRTSREDIEAREEHPVSNYAQYCSIVRTGFGKTKMIIGGEVDAVMDVKPADKSLPINWVELKTSAELFNDRERIKFERKLLKFWAQSFLLGVPKIVVGFRNSEGILQRLEEVDTQGIPEQVRHSGNQAWDGQICINFASNFLDWLKSIITEEGVWRLRKTDKAVAIEAFKVEDRGCGQILSREFIDWRTIELPALQREQQPPQQD